MKSIKLYRKDGTFLEKRKVNLDNLKEYDKGKIQEAEKYMNYLIDNEYVNNFELLDNLFSNNMSLDNLNTNYTHAIACIEQSKRIKNKLDEMGLYSYLVTCKPDKFLSKHGDELLIESHTILVHPCLYNKKISFVIFDPGFRLKNSVLIIDKENSCDKRFYDGIYKIEYKKDNDSIIKIESLKENDKTILSIYDNGIGINKKDIKNVFKKSFTGENGRNLSKSTGMGLYIAKRLCDKLGHKILIESEKNEYTIVKIIFGNNDYYKIDN